MIEGTLGSIVRDPIEGDSKVVLKFDSNKQRDTTGENTGRLSFR